MENFQRKYTEQQLKQLEKQDFIYLENFIESDFFFNDQFIIENFFFKELESNINQYNIDNEKLQKIKRKMEKWKNIEAALSCFQQGKSSLIEELSSNTNGMYCLKQKELKWIRKEIENICNSLGGNDSPFGNIFKIKVNFFQNVYNSIMRRDLRNLLKKAKKLNLSLINQQVYFFKIKLFNFYFSHSLFHNYY